MQIHVDHCSFDEYRALENQRLRATQLEESQLLHLMMRCEGEGAEALRAPVFLKSLERHLGRVSFGVFYTDIDLRPLPKGHASELIEDYWVPKVPLPLNSERVHAVARTGYFVPYRTELDDELLVLADELSLVRVGPRPTANL